MGISRGVNGSFKWVSMYGISSKSSRSFARKGGEVTSVLAWAELFSVGKLMADNCGTLIGYLIETGFMVLLHSNGWEFTVKYVVWASQLHFS